MFDEDDYTSVNDDDVMDTVEEDEPVIDLLGGDLSNVLTPEINMTKPLVIIALGLLLVLLGNMAMTYIIEPFRVREMQVEMNDVMTQAATLSLEQYQRVNPRDFKTAASSQRALNSYCDFLDTYANNKHDTELKEASRLIRTTATRNSTIRYTPLNFGLTYLDPEVIEQVFYNNTREIIKREILDTRYQNIGSMDNTNRVSAALEEIYLGSGRISFDDATVSVGNPQIYNITNIASADYKTRMMYLYVYGTLDPNAAKVSNSAQNLINNKYLVVYPITFTLKWTPYAGTEFLRTEDSSWSRYTNKNHYLQMIDRTNRDRLLAQGKKTLGVTQYTTLYCITN